MRSPSRTAGRSCAPSKTSSATGFNVSVAELDDANLWNRATLGIVAISASSAYLAGQMQEIDKAIQRLANSLSAEILESYVEDIAD